MQYWLHQPPDVRPENIPEAAKPPPGTQPHSTTREIPPTNTTVKHTTPSESATQMSSAPNFASSTSTNATGQNHPSYVDIVEEDEFDSDDDMMDMDMAFGMDLNSETNRNTQPPQHLDHDSDEDISNNNLNNYSDEEDDDDDEYGEPFHGKQKSHYDTDLFGEIYEPESPETPISNKKRSQPNSKATAKAAASTPHIFNDNTTYISFAKEHNITQRSIAANYKADGFELSYSRPMRPVAKTLDWDSENFTIQNILPLKADRSQLMAYLIW